VLEGQLLDLHSRLVSQHTYLDREGAEESLKFLINAGADVSALLRMLQSTGADQ
jgi:hypothetical protein